MALRCGIVGLPNVGKSTLFNALTKAGIASENYPFCTIDPNIGVVPVPDTRLDRLAEISKSLQIIPATVQFVDIAGLVEGASQGEGLGNKFLANIRETQAILHVVRCFENDDVTHVAGKVDPLSDIEVINTELALADLETVQKVLLKLGKDVKRGDKEAKQAEALLTRGAAHLNEGKSLRAMDLNEEERGYLQQYQLLTLKPILYVANVDEVGLSGNDFVRQVETYAVNEGAKVVPVCAALEAEIVELTDDEQQEFLASVGLTEPGLNRIIHASYDLLGLQTYFTVGPKEARAWTISRGASAPEAAGVIHSDFEKGFIRAEVIAFEDYLQCHGEQGAKEAGKWRLEGKDYRVKDGDVILFRFNV